jgi:hypothetical protein
MNSENALSDLRRMVAEATTKKKELQESFQKLSDSLVETCDGIDIEAETELVTFSSCEPADLFEHGYLQFRTGDGIRICYRDQDDCQNEAQNPQPYEGGHFKIRGCDDVPVEWLRIAVASGRLEELLQNVTTALRQHVADLHLAAQAVQRPIASPTLAIGSTFSEIATQIGYETVVEDWKSAERDIVSDPANAISRACSLIETVCKHLIADLQVDLPADQSIQPLFKAAARALGLDPTQQANSELQGLCRGLATVVQNLGVLRTRFSTAHGRGPSQKPMSPSHARLAVNTAGSVSTFLMEQWHDTQLSKIG